MSYRSRALGVVLVTILIVSARASSADEPIADHPPVTASGAIATFDPLTGIIRFDDGRMVKLTDQSKLVQPVASVIRVGDRVALRDVLPIGVQSGVKTLALGQPQRMGTIASVDESRALVHMTDGTVVRVTRSTNVHLGAAGSNVALTQLNPGDELVVIFRDGGARTPAAVDDVTVSPSALAREDGPPAAVEAGEVMIFKVPRRP